MIELPKSKRWTGDGFGDINARILNQLKRNDKAALYQRIVEKSGKSEGYEVFSISMRHKGDALPGGMVEAEDREVYPSAGSFGRTAWHHWNLKVAETRFEELTREETAKENPEPKKTPVPPDGALLNVFKLAVDMLLQT